MPPEMKFEPPIIREVHLNLVDPGLVLGKTLVPKELKFGFLSDAYFVGKNSLEFIATFRIDFLKANDKIPSLLETTYLSQIKIPEQNWEGKEQISLEKNFVAHLLGMSILMIRGAIKIRLGENSLSAINFPIINPSKSLESRLKEVDGEFIIPSVQLRMETKTTTQNFE